MTKGSEKRFANGFATLALASVACLGGAMVALAQTPVAIVESVDGPVSGAEQMEYLAPGQVIKLGASGRIVLAYLSSCMRETITGGVVIVGSDESRTSLADIKSEKILCNTGQAQLAKGTGSGGGMAFRNKQHDEATWSVMVYALSPMIEVSEPGLLVIERLDKPGERYETALAKASLVKAKFHDLAGNKIELKRGGVYAATLGAHKVVFKVDELAEATGPLTGRLVRL